MSQTKLLLFSARDLASIAASFRLNWYESMSAGLVKLRAIDLIKRVATLADFVVVVTMATVAATITAMAVAAADSYFIYLAFSHLEIVAYDGCFLLAHRSLCL